MAMISLNTTLPPHTDPAVITLAAHLLASLADPASSQAKLQELADATDAMRKAHADARSARAEADQAAAALSDLTAREKVLADKQAEHAQAVTQLAVASQANEKRGQLSTSESARSRPRLQTCNAGLRRMMRA
jgi:hypothetical protein